MNATEAFQRAFAAHLRNPDVNPPPAGVDAQRAGVYVELLFNNVEDFLSNCFPVLRSILDDATWNALVRQFYAEHTCTTPYFREISAEFVQWLTATITSTTLSERLPFLLELVHYEWVEIPLMLEDSNIDWQHIDADGDLLDGIPVLNPVMLLQSYQYPVHRISSAYLPNAPDPTHLLLLRNPQNRIEFVVLNTVTARLVQLLQEGLSGRAAITCIAQDIQHPNPIQLLEFGLQLLNQFKQQHVLLGVIIR
ncbi:hypothetical protein SAMN05660964_00442 [Thiothrix caldifontis]|uniref:Uncharacterized protein n=1 Tax=Thiothrix caldifontis TaxID=525918 RepID=A0A1H3WGV3_9GAMM|nr:putative DNA-binding domain-containing protein [Thiothrix caldifontis]SDZ86335.1 hypothetical protein SAMN05660964_00442 [Thiothrix caldifontis]